MMGETVWVCGQTLNHETSSWELQGVFTTQEAATAACRDATYFVGPVAVDQPLPHDRVEWTGAYYPLA